MQLGRAFHAPQQIITSRCDNPGHISHMETLERDDPNTARHRQGPEPGLRAGSATRQNTRAASARHLWHRGHTDLTIGIAAGGRACNAAGSVDRPPYAGHLPGKSAEDRVLSLPL